jgi:large subunit ribosomal protein L19
MNDSDKKSPEVESSAPEAEVTSSSALPKSLTRREIADIVSGISTAQMKSDLPEFRSGDTVRVHAKIVEGNKERIQIFEGVVIERQGVSSPQATFTVRKISYNVGVERKFLVHSPRIEKIEVISRGQVRRAKLYYLRGIRGKASKIKSRYDATLGGSRSDAPFSQEAETKADGVDGSSKDGALESQASA